MFYIPIFSLICSHPRTKWTAIFKIYVLQDYNDLIQLLMLVGIDYSHLFRPAGSVKEGLDMKKQIRKESHLRAQIRDESGWSEVDVTKHLWETPEYVQEEEYTLLNRNIGQSLLGVFLTFVPVCLLKRVWDDGNQPGIESWTTKRGDERAPTLIAFSAAIHQEG